MSKLFGKKQSSKLWSSTGNQVQGEINLRTELHEILFGSAFKPQRGHWVIYRRFDTSTFTPEYNEVYGAGVGNVSHPYTDTLVMTRRDPIFAPEDNEKSTPFGILVGARDGYYFEYDMKPNPNDQIIEINWDDHTVKPVISQLVTPHVDKYNIKEVYPYRLDAGRVEYWVAFVNLDRINY